MEGISALFNAIALETAAEILLKDVLIQIHELLNKYKKIWDPRPPTVTRKKLVTLQLLFSKIANKNIKICLSTRTVKALVDEGVNFGAALYLISSPRDSQIKREEVLADRNYFKNLFNDLFECLSQNRNENKFIDEVKELIKGKKVDDLFDEFNALNQGIQNQDVNKDEELDPKQA